MSNIKLLDVAGISALAVERYLNFLGWSKDNNFPNKNLWVFQNASFNSIENIVIPSSELFDDFSIDLIQVVEKISSIVSKDEKEIIKEIKGVYFDRLEFRIKSPISNEGKLPMEYASQCIQGLKNLILYAACAEQDAKPICSKATQLAKNLLSKFDLCQTEIGSYIINIDTQVIDDNFDQNKLFSIENISSEHKIVKRIMTSLEQVDSTIKSDVKITDLTSDAYEHGITANICDALLALKCENQSIEIETTAKYASALMEKTGENKTVLIDDRHFGIINEIAKIYRNNTLTEDVEIIGIIKKMAIDASDEEPERAIYINTRLDGKYRTLRAVLSQADHLIACDAYKNDIEVYVSGELDKSKRTWEFVSVSNFQLKE
jgi:uncharacterized protein (UPF0335 family)